MIDQYQKQAITRLKKARGQIDGLIRMIEKNKYEPDIMTQTFAVQGALKGVVMLLLESHLQTNAINQISTLNPRKKDKFINELLKVFKVSTR